MEIEPLHDDFGARVRGIDLTGPLPPDLVETLHVAIDEHSVLLFPDEDMSDEAQLLLVNALGEPEEGHIAFGRTGEIVNIGTIGNVIDAHSQRDESDPHTIAQKGNDLWRSNSRSGGFRPMCRSCTPMRSRRGRRDRVRESAGRLRSPHTGEAG